MTNEYWMGKFIIKIFVYQTLTKQANFPPVSIDNPPSWESLNTKKSHLLCRDAVARGQHHAERRLFLLKNVIFTRLFVKGGRKINTRQSYSQMNCILLRHAHYYFIYSFISLFLSVLWSHKIHLYSKRITKRR